MARPRAASMAGMRRRAGAGASRRSMTTGACVVTPTALVATRAPSATRKTAGIQSLPPSFSDHPPPLTEDSPELPDFAAFGPYSEIKRPVASIIGVAEAGKEIATRPFQLVTGRVWKGSAFGGARGSTDVPKIVDWYMTQKIAIDPMITHVLTLEEINRGFELMHAGESIRSVVVY